MHEPLSPSMLRRIAIAAFFSLFYLGAKHLTTDLQLPANTWQQREVEQRRRSERLHSLPQDSVKRVAFVTFSYVTHNDTKKLLDFLLPAVDTWATTRATFLDNSTGFEEDTLPLYVVFAESSRDPFESACLREEGVVTSAQRTLCRRIEPIYVDCPEGKYGASPCCKQQKGLLALHDNYSAYPLYDWYAFFDDDVYLRSEYVARFLGRVFDRPDAPMAVVSRSQDKKPVGLTGSRKRQTCRGHVYPWGQPIFYSRGALALMAPGYRANSLMRQCDAFGATHDVGNQVLNWMYGLSMAKLPPLNNLPYFRDDNIGSHWVGREDMRKLLFSEDRWTRPDPRTGTRTLIKARPAGAFSFYKTHTQWSHPRMKPPELNALGIASIPEEHLWYKNVTGGFRKTRTFAQFGEPQMWEEGVWHTMQPSDCNI